MAKVEKITIALVCTKCKRRNYTFRRNKKQKAMKKVKKLELKKFCPFCRAHTVHKESKV